jgi:hypothetical protein
MLQFNENNTRLTCKCGAVVVTASAWNAMTEHTQHQMREKAVNCQTCIKDKEVKYD